LDRRRLPLHPILFAVYPPLFLLALNLGQASPAVAGLAAAASIATVVLLWTGLGLALRSRERGALVATLLAALFFSYGHVHAALHVRLMGPFPGEGLAGVLHAALSVLAILAFFAVLRRVRRASTEAVGRAGPILEVAGVALCLMPLTSVAWHAAGARDAADPARALLREPWGTSLPPAAAPADRPDIYLIVLDGWARHDVLRGYFPEDDGAFLDGLRARGFRVLPESRANYAWTILSLASTLNMDYLDPVLGPAVPVDERQGLLAEMIRNGRAAQYLRGLGYRFVHFGSTWGATSSNPYADEVVTCRSGGLLRNEYVRVLAETTALRAFSDWPGRDLAECWNEQYASLGEMGGRPGPKFVLAHFLQPHHPYLFDRDGNVLRHATVSNQFELDGTLWARRDLYSGQMAYTGRRILEAVGRILDESPQPPVIVVLSDHGPHVLDPRLGTIETARLRLSTLMAVHVPGKPRLFPDRTSAVNTFRILFNHLFGAGFEVLPDRSFASAYKSWELRPVPF